MVRNPAVRKLMAAFVAPLSFPCCSVPILQLPWTWGVTKGMMGTPLGRQLGLEPSWGASGAAPAAETAAGVAAGAGLGPSSTAGSGAASIDGRLGAAQVVAAAAAGFPASRLGAPAASRAQQAPAQELGLGQKTAPAQGMPNGASPATPAAAAANGDQALATGPGAHLPPSSGAGAATVEGGSASSTPGREMQRRGSKRQRVDAARGGQEEPTARGVLDQEETGRDGAAGSGRQQAWRGAQEFGNGAGSEPGPAAEVAAKQEQVVHAVATLTAHHTSLDVNAEEGDSEAATAKAVASNKGDDGARADRAGAGGPGHQGQDAQVAAACRDLVDAVDDEQPPAQVQMQDGGAGAAAEAAALRLQLMQRHSRSHLQVFGGPGDLLEEAAAAAIAAGLTQPSSQPRPRPPSLNSRDSGAEDGSGSDSGAGSSYNGCGGELMLGSTGGAGTGGGGGAMLLPPLSSASTSIASRVIDSTVASVNAAEWVVDATEAGGRAQSPAHHRREMGASGGGAGAGAAGASGAGGSGSGLGQRLLQLPRQGSVQGLKSLPHGSAPSSVAAAMWAAKSGGGGGPHGGSKEAASMVSGEASAAAHPTHGKSLLGPGGSPRAAATAATAAARAGKTAGGEAYGAADCPATGAATAAAGVATAAAGAATAAAEGSSGWLQVQQPQQGLADSPRGSGIIEATFSGAPMPLVRPGAQVAAAIAAAAAAAAAAGGAERVEAPALSSTPEDPGYPAATAAADGAGVDAGAGGEEGDESVVGDGVELELEVHAVDLREVGSPASPIPASCNTPTLPAAVPLLTSPPSQLCSSAANTGSITASANIAAAAADAAYAAASASHLSTLQHIRVADSPLPPCARTQAAAAPAAAGSMAASAPSSMHSAAVAAAAAAAALAPVAAPFGTSHASMQLPQPPHVPGAAPAGCSPALGYSQLGPGYSPQSGYGFPTSNNSFRNRSSYGYASSQQHSARLAHLPHGSSLLSPPPPPLPAATPTPGPTGTGFLLSPPRTGESYVDTGDVALASHMSLGGGLAPCSTDFHLAVAGSWARAPPSHAGYTTAMRLLQAGAGAGTSTGIVASGGLDGGAPAWPSSGHLAPVTAPQGAGAAGAGVSVLSPRFGQPPMPPQGQPGGRPTPRRMTFSGIAGADERDTVAMTVPEDAPLPPPLTVPAAPAAPSSGVLSPAGLGTTSYHHQQPRHYVPQRTGKAAVRALKHATLADRDGAVSGSGVGVMRDASGGGDGDVDAPSAAVRARTALGARMLRRLRQVASSRWSNNGGGSRTHAGGSVTSEATAAAADAGAGGLGGMGASIGGSSLAAHARTPQPTRSIRQATDSQLHFPAAPRSQPLPPLPPPAPLAVPHGQVARAVPSPRFFAGLQGLLRIGSPRDSNSDITGAGVHGRGSYGGNVVWTDNPSATGHDYGTDGTAGAGGRHTAGDRSTPGEYSMAALAAAVAGAASTGGLAHRHVVTGSLPLPKLPGGTAAAVPAGSGGGGAPLEARASSLTPTRSSSVLRRMAQLVSFGAAGGAAGAGAGGGGGAGSGGGAGNGGAAAGITAALGSGPSGMREVVSLSAAATAAAVAQARAQANERGAGSSGRLVSGTLLGGSGNGSGVLELSLPEGLSPSASTEITSPAAQGLMAAGAVAAAYGSAFSRLSPHQQQQQQQQHQNAVPRQGALSISGGGSSNSRRVLPLPKPLSVPELQGEPIVAAAAAAATAGAAAPDARFSGGSTSSSIQCVSGGAAVATPGGGTGGGSPRRNYASSPSLPSSPTLGSGGGGLWGQHQHTHTPGQYQQQSPPSHTRSPSRLQVASTSPLASAGQLPSPGQLAVAPASPGGSSPRVPQDGGVDLHLTTGGAMLGHAGSGLGAAALPADSRPAPRLLQAARSPAMTAPSSGTQLHGQLSLGGDATFSSGIPHLSGGGAAAGGDRSSAHGISGGAASVSDACVSIGPVVMARMLDGISAAPSQQQLQQQRHQQQLQEMQVLAEAVGAAVDRALAGVAEPHGLAAGTAGAAPSTTGTAAAVAAGGTATAVAHMAGTVSEQEVTLEPAAVQVPSVEPAGHVAGGMPGPGCREPEVEVGGGGGKKGKKGVFGRLMKSVKEAFK